MPTISDLRQRQALPLSAKVSMTKARIREWYNHWDGDVYVSFSGGKDSTVLAHLVHDIYPNVPLVFSNTGLEYPEIQSFAKKMNAIFVRPDVSFSDVISKWGYPIISKEVAGSIYYARTIRGGLEAERRRSQLNSGRRNQLLGETVTTFFDKRKWLPLCNETQFMIGDNCCSQIKKKPLRKYQKHSNRVPIIGTLAEESKQRENAWIKNGCNAFESKKPISQPMSFWLEQDVLQYIKDERLEIASIYGDVVTVDSDGMEYDALLAPCGKLKCTGCQRTGCIFCGFGVHLDKGETRFQRLAKTHPRQYEYCMSGGNGLTIRSMTRQRQSMTVNG